MQHIVAHVELRPVEQCACATPLLAVLPIWPLTQYLYCGTVITLRNSCSQIEKIETDNPRGSMWINYTF
jgi:hypothetical protein